MLGNLDIKNNEIIGSYGNTRKNLIDLSRDINFDDNQKKLKALRDDVKKSQYLKSSNNYVEKSKDKKGFLEIKERTLINDDDFQSFFKGEPSQGNLGNCYLISALWVIKDFKDFPILMKGSISKTNGVLKIGENNNNQDWYTVKMPLGEPGGIDIHISEKEINLARLKGPKGFKILELAYTKHVINHFDKSKIFNGILLPDIMSNWSENKQNNAFNVIKGGTALYALNTLLGSKNIEGITFETSSMKNKYTKAVLIQNINKENDPEKKQKLYKQFLKISKNKFSLKELSILEKKAIYNILKKHSLKKGESVLLSTLTGPKGDTSSYDIDEDSKLVHGHAYSVKSVELDGDGKIKKIFVQNPWNKKDNNKKEYFGTISMTFEQLIENFSRIEISRTNKEFLDGKTNPGDITITDNFKNRNKKIEAINTNIH